MPHLAFDIDFCAQLSKLQGGVKQGVFDAWEKFEHLTLDQLFKDQGLKLETLKRARDPHIRTIRIDQGTRGVVLAPDSGDTYVLLRVMPHDKAIAWAIKQKASINTVTRAVEIRDIAMLDELTPAYEQIAPAPDERLFAKVSDGDMAALGIDETTLRQARVLTDAEQLEVFAPYFPQDQREVLEYLAAGFSVEDVWRDVVSVAMSTVTAGDPPVDTQDFATAIQRTRARIALVSASDELRDILDKPFAAWRVFLHPSQHKVAYRPSYSGPAQVTGGPGTGKTVVALHRVRHLLGHLRDGDRVLLTTYTNALVTALRAELDALVTRVCGWLGSGIAPGEIGVSARFNKTCDRAVDRLRAAGVPAARLRGNAPADPDTVQIGTMHAFKGLEFRCVAVIGVSEGALPFPKAVTAAEVDRLQHDADLLAERCLLFVACTRARDGLYVSWSGDPSEFLVETGAVDRQALPDRG
ncbi:3'-5' exonuclease [Streptomyces sp. NPDC102282]|uniref:3'-5' exonuclease n=1 Tax=Streptomyces sp. NPDC102282 TaxID=3366154 RepID=UPI003824C84D